MDLRPFIPFGRLGQSVALVLFWIPAFAVYALVQIIRWGFDRVTHAVFARLARP